MTRTSENGWTSDHEKRGYDLPLDTQKDFDSQRDKPMKAVIGIALLVVLALALSRMHPVPHDVPDDSAAATGQITGAGGR
ncbi:MAG: hypothetical protein NVV83_20190 [Afipia sp.]|jgi:hypothetical protein|nr:hypothetical protein [Afipia sp.]